MISVCFHACLLLFSVVLSCVGEFVCDLSIQPNRAFSVVYVIEIQAAPCISIRCDDFNGNNTVFLFIILTRVSSAYCAEQTK